MATNIEQIFRSFVVSKFREIQQQQLGSGKLGQPNGEIDSSEQVKSADDTIASIGVLQNDPLVQKIEQVLSEVLGAEPQYKPDAGQDTVKNKSRSAKRGIPDEVQDEIPRKKSKKDKKHKDKKKKKRKKEKKEKKYKKQSKESKLNYDHKGCEDIQPASCLNSESLVLSAENMDVGSTSPLKHDSEWFMEKTVYENVNSSLSNSHDASNSDTSKLYASEEDSVLINIQELCEVQVTNERELETDICQHTNLVVNIPVEDEFLNTAIEGDNTCVKEVEQAETGSALRTAENINVPENSPKFMTVELKDLETRVEFHSVEGKELDSLSESLDPEVLAQSESISLEKTECKLMKTHLETIVEAKDSVTTLGFLAMVVGKDFEATSEFLNKAKVKVSGSSPKDDAKGMKDELEQDSERIAMMKELEKTLRTESRLEKKNLEENSATEKEDSESISESDERKSIDASVEPETIRTGELKETQTPAIVIKLKDPLKYQKSVEPEMRDFRRMSELEVMKRADSRAYILDKKIETKNVDAAAESKEMDVRCLSGTTVCESEKEKWDNIPERMGLKNLSSPEFAGAVRVNYLEASLETAVEKKDDMVVSEDSKMAVEVKVSASTPRSEMTPETLKITKTQYLDFSKQGTVTDIGGETDINLKDLKKVPEQPSVTLKNLETVSEMQYLTGMKHVKNVLQSDVTTQGKDLESNLKPEGQREDKDLDAASESLHMIFTNYSEHSLELYTEPEATMEVKNSEKVPELLPMEDVNNSEALSPMEVKGLKTIESTTVVKLNDLEKKKEYLHRGVKNRGTESKALTDVKYLETYVQSEPGTKERDKKVPSYSVTGVKQKALDTAESLGKGQYDAETADWKIKSGCLSMKDTTEKEPSAEIKRPLFISESFQEVSILNSETAPEVDAIPGMQELKETGRYIPILEVDSPDTPAGLEMSALIDPKDASKLLNTAEDFESISGYQVVENLDSLQFANDQAINFDSQRALQVKYTVSSPKLLFSDELTNLQEKQKLEESTEAASFTTAPESPDTSGTELIVASESGEVHEVIDAEHCSKTIYMEQANSDNFLKSLYTMHLKGSKTISESKIMDAKNLEIEPEYSHREGIETGHFSEYESVASSQVLEISEESPKKNEMQESNTAFGSKALTVSGLEVNSETLCAINIDNLEVVKKAHVAPTSLGMISTEGTRIPVSAMEDKNIKASETVKTKVEIKHLLASTTPVGIARETFHPIHVTDSKVSEASQMLETNLESVHKKEVNTKLDHEAVLSGSETFKKPKPVVATSTTEGMLPVINIAEENKSGTDLKPEAALVEKYSESVSESNKVSTTKDCDSALSLFMVDVKDSELRSDFLDAGQVKTLNTTVQFETTPEPLCVLELGNSDDVVESVLTTEMKELGETLNCEVVLEAKDSGPIATNVIASELKPSESLCVLEISNSEGIIELTTPTYLSSAHLKPDKTTEIEALDSNSEAPLKSGMDVKYFESVSESDCVLEQFHYKTVPESEYVLEEKVSETSELVSMKLMEAIPEPKHAQETKDLEPLAQSVCVAQATCVEKNIVYAEVRDVSETTPKFSGIIEIKDLGATMSSVLAETEKKSDENLRLYFEEKCSETATECIQMPDLMETSADVESVCRIEGNYAEMANSGLTGVTELKDTAFVKSKTGPEPGHLKDLEAVPNSESLGKVKDMQIAQSSIDKKEGMYFEGSSESVLILERQDLERDSTSVLGSEVVSEESLKSVPAVKAKDSEVALKYIDAKGVEISEQNTKYVCMGEMKDLPSVLEHVELAQAKSSETFSEGTLEVKNLEAAMCLAKEKKSEATVLASLEEQILKASLEPICGAEKNNLVVSQQVMREMKDSEAASESVNMLEKEASSCISLKDQHSEAVPESSEITKKNDESISKDRKSEKVSSKSKDKSKSGKKTKKSRSKSPSKSKKRKKKSRSRSTSRQISSRRARSRSKNDSDSRKKHSTSRRRSRSNSAEKKESKERSLRTRRRRSRTSDRHKSRSKSVDKRETSLRSRRRHSRSSDRRKSRSRSIDRRESIRTRRRLSRSSDNRKSRSKSYDRREILIRSRRRLSRSSDRHKSRSRSTDKRETSIRTRRRRSRSSEYHKSRSRSVEKRETSVRRRRRRSRSSDNYKSRSKSVDRRESSVRSRRRRSRSSDHHKSRSRSVDDKREISVRTRRKRSRSSENRRSQSKSVEKRESLRPRRRRSRTSNNRKSRSKSGDKETPRTRRRRSRSSDNRKTRSESVDKRESSVRARRRRSRSSDRKSRSKSVDKRESSVRAKRRRSRSSDNKSRSKSVDRRETSTRAKDRRSRSSDNRKSRSKSVDKRETSTRAKRRRSRSCDNRKSRSKSVDKRESSVRARRRRSRSSDNRKSRSKSFDKRETSARSKRKRSRSSENCKSRSKSVDKTDVSGSSKRRRSKSSDHKPVTKASEKRDSSSKSGLRRSKSLDRQKSKSKSRSKSSEREKDKDSSDVTKGKGSKSRSKSKSPEKTEGTEVSEATVHSHAKSPEHPKSKSRSRSKSLDKTRDRPRRSRSKCSEPKSHSHRTVSRSRRNRSRSLTRKRTSRSKSDNRSHSRSRSRSCSRRWRRSRSRSVSRQRSLSRERRRRSRRNRSRSVDRRRRRSDSRDSYRIPLRLRSRSRTPVQLRTTRSAGRRRSTSVSPDHRRSRSASRSPKRLTDLDKAQLLEIAKANAAAMCAKAGVPLPPSLMPVATPEKKEEKVTQKSAKETIMELTEKCKKIAQSQEDDVILNKPHVSDEEEEEHPFINHPFKLSEPKPIFFNLTTPTIKPAPPKNQVTLTKEFPVSSGSQHRKKEADSAYGEWVPVEKNKEENKDDVFPNPATLEPVDISSALSERTIAQKRLTENTFDLEAMCLLNRAQERIDAWAQLNSLPGQFTGSTGAQVLSSEQLSNSGPQAWIKKDQFLRAAPVSGGMGAQLMRKMGWREGEGLGKNKEGSREPILVDFKTDRKGLVAVGEKTQKRHGAFSGVKDLAGKHPISVLVEACNKRRWPPPTFVLVTDNGPDHRKCFLFKVMVNGVEHKPTFASPNKKLAKTTAATVALQALGIVPKELLVNATSFRSASHN